MPSALVEDDEEGGEQELDGQESAGKFTEKVCRRASSNIIIWY